MTESLLRCSKDNWIGVVPATWFALRAIPAELVYRSGLEPWLAVLALYCWCSSCEASSGCPGIRCLSIVNLVLLLVIQIAGAFNSTALCFEKQWSGSITNSGGSCSIDSLCTVASPGSLRQRRWLEQ